MQFASIPAKQKVVFNLMVLCKICSVLKFVYINFTNIYIHTRVCVCEVSILQTSLKSQNFLMHFLAFQELLWEQFSKLNKF